MKLLLLMLVTISCPVLSEGLTPDEKKSLNVVFQKAKYILGAAYDSQNIQYDKQLAYKNIPDFNARTNTLKADIEKLRLQAQNINGGLEISLALADMALCVSFDKSAMSYCSQALKSLKNWDWEDRYGTSWSGYGYGKPWIGFPSDM
jgi:hypothetical protein